MTSVTGDLRSRQELRAGNLVLGKYPGEVLDVSGSSPKLIAPLGDVEQVQEWNDKRPLLDQFIMRPDGAMVHAYDGSPAYEAIQQLESVKKLKQAHETHEAYNQEGVGTEVVREDARDTIAAGGDPRAKAKEQFESGAAFNQVGADVVKEDA